jgi:hypothetical protein
MDRVGESEFDDRRTRCDASPNTIEKAARTIADHDAMHRRSRWIRTRGERRPMTSLRREA